MTTDEQNVVDQIRKLDGLPSLKKLYVSGREYGDLELTAKDALPKVSVLPLAINPRR